MNVSIKRGPRAHNSYRANQTFAHKHRRIAIREQRTASHLFEPTGKSWPNPRNPVLSLRENFRRLQQMRRAAHAAYVAQVSA